MLSENGKLLPIVKIVQIKKTLKSDHKEFVINVSPRHITFVNFLTNVNWKFL
jgi:hypothetical protein